VTKYDWFRRRIAPVAFGVAIVLMARESCHHGEQREVTFVIDLGAARPEVRVVDAELWAGGQRISVLHRAAVGGTIGNIQFKAMLPEREGEVRMDVETTRRLDHVVRNFFAEDGSTITLRVGETLK
jgi:hypothetical protein